MPPLPLLALDEFRKILRYVTTHTYFFSYLLGMGAAAAQWTADENQGLVIASLCSSTEKDVKSSKSSKSGKSAESLSFTLLYHVTCTQLQFSFVGPRWIRPDSHCEMLHVVRCMNSWAAIRGRQPAYHIFAVCSRRYGGPSSVSRALGAWPPFGVLVSQELHGRLPGLFQSCMENGALCTPSC